MCVCGNWRFERFERLGIPWAPTRRWTGRHRHLAVTRVYARGACPFTETFFLSFVLWYSVTHKWRWPHENDECLLTREVYLPHPLLEAS